MTRLEELEKALGIPLAKYATWPATEQSLQNSVAEVALAAYKLGLARAVEECKRVADQSAALRPDVMRLAVRIAHRAKGIVP